MHGGMHVSLARVEDRAREVRPIHRVGKVLRLQAEAVVLVECDASAPDDAVQEAAGVELWRRLRDVGVAPAGLGARDTLRLEAGLNLYGQDLDEQTSPLASNIAWTIAWEPQERDFIGRQALTAERQHNDRKLTGLIMRDKGILRHGQVVHTDAGPGVITSGTYSPSLEYSIGLARVPKAASGECEVDIRGKRKAATLCKPPFVRNGNKMHP